MKARYWLILVLVLSMSIFVYTNYFPQERTLEVDIVSVSYEARVIEGFTPEETVVKVMPNGLRYGAKISNLSVWYDCSDGSTTTNITGTYPVVSFCPRNTTIIINWGYGLITSDEDENGVIQRTGIKSKEYKYYE